METSDLGCSGTEVFRTEKAGREEYVQTADGSFLHWQREDFLKNPGIVGAKRFV